MNRLRITVALAVVAVVVALLVRPHLSPGAHLTSAPTSTLTPSAVASDSPSPRPTILPALAGPRLFPVDDMQMRAPLAFGRISLTNPAGGVGMPVSRYVLSVPPTTLPSSGTVWRLGTLDKAGLAGVSAFFDLGPVPTPQPGTTEYDSGTLPLSLHVDLAAGVLDYEGTPSHLQVGAPHDALSAVLLADHILDAIGLQTSGRGKPQPVDTDGAWRVTYPRILDFPVDGAAAVVDFDTEGTLGDLHVSLQPLRGGSTYELAPWQQAWRQVAAGRWYAMQAEIENGNSDVSMPAITFHATSVRLGYYAGSPAGGPAGPLDALVPMYVFHDAGGNIDLYYPALTASEMSYKWEPGPPQQ